jgi:hypothetical protein
MYRHVAVFQTSKCQAKGMETRIKAMNEKALKMWLIVIIMEMSRT